MKLSAHFSLEEATASSTAKNLGLENLPTAEHLVIMKHTAEGMEKVRELLGSDPIKVNSWYRNPELNAAVGGVPTSQHAKGEAVDFTAPWFGTPKEVCLKLIKHKKELGYDQLILEPTWIHISFTSSKPRGAELTYHGGKKYTSGIV